MGLGRRQHPPAPGPVVLLILPKCISGGRLCGTVTDEHHITGRSVPTSGYRLHPSDSYRPFRPDSFLPLRHHELELLFSANPRTNK
ncbi:hypothetical protein BRADI_2g24405v3 [Brachypodium distachyon]|uniref:Uncharacterized protein n=1 Tax=Brachypodium distachyon TaxID=15368 RepID=A0A2K2DA90_BRADI|nr:hypothetical protein BRADI_2g24405v3 [Brachypodium distachyon]